MDVLLEVVDRERAREPGRAVGGQYVAGPGHVVTDRGRREWPGEHRARVADERHQCVGIGAHELQVLGGDQVGDLEGLVGRVHEHRVPALGEGGGDLVAPGRFADQSVDLARDSLDRVRRPRDQPGEPTRAVLGLHDQVDGREGRRRRVVRDHHDLGRPGERRRDTDDARNLALGDRHVDVAGADDDVDRQDRLGAVGHGGDGLGAPDGVHLVDTRNRSRGKGDGRHAPPFARRDAERDLGHAGHPCRHRGHQHGGRIDRAASRDVEAGPVDRTAQVADA